MRNEDVPRLLYVLIVVHAAPPNRTMPIAICNIRIVLVYSTDDRPKGANISSLLGLSDNREKIYSEAKTIATETMAFVFIYS